MSRQSHPFALTSFLGESFFQLVVCFKFKYVSQ